MPKLSMIKESVIMSVQNIVSNQMRSFGKRLGRDRGN